MYNIKKNTKSKNMKEILNNPEIIYYVSNLIIILIIIFLIIFIFFSDFHIIIIHYKNKNPKIKLIINDFIKIKLEKEIKLKPINKYTLKKTIYFYKKTKYLINKYDDLIKDILKEIKITKLSIISSYKTNNIETNNYLKFSTLIIYNLINLLINKYFKDVQNDRYKIIDNNEKNQIYYEIEFSLKTYQIWKIFINKYKYLKEIKKEF